MSIKCRQTTGRWAVSLADLKRFAAVNDTLRGLADSLAPDLRAYFYLFSSDSLHIVIYTDDPGVQLAYSVSSESTISLDTMRHQIDVKFR